MPACYECSAPFTIPRGTNPDTLICASCGECPAQQCRDCGNHYAPDELESERCEECHEGHKRVVARERREAIEEARGDYLRDEGKDWRAW